MITLTQLVQSHRRKAGLTQAELAQLAGVGKTVVWDVEHGKESVQWDTLQKIFRVLSITVEWQSPFFQRSAISTQAFAVQFESPRPPSPSPTSAASSPPSRSPRQKRSS
jgi:DNA-binding XRE family transcriptional regulator